MGAVPPSPKNQRVVLLAALASLNDMVFRLSQEIRAAIPAYVLEEKLAAALHARALVRERLKLISKKR